MKAGRLFGLFSFIALLTLLLVAGSIEGTLWITGSQRAIIDVAVDPIFGLPFVLYLLFGVILIALLSILMIYVGQRVRQNQLSKRLAQLVAGQYEAPILARQQQANRVLGPEIGQALESLRQKMIRLQREIQHYSNQPVLVAGESKEEILEQERHRLARELHDSVSQQLFAAMMMLSALRSVVNQRDPDAAELKQLSTIESVINEAQAEMRALLLHLRPTNLEGKSLKDGIISLLKELQTKIKIKITWQLDDVQLSAANEDNLFRIVQELLSNTLRHAKANSLEVYLKQVDQNVILRVIDDGVGFELDAGSENGSYGLKNIQERAQSIGGTAKFVSFKNQGTSVEIRVPVTKEVSHD